jgi:phospholipid/cholesterol/gamma-HCH transport system substrate-binding protein
MRMPWRSKLPVSRSPYDDNQPDPRVWGRHYTGPRPWVLGVVVTILALIASYLAFAKELPWSDDGYTLNATFANAATLRETAPVRIAGVNVGQVTSVDAKGDLAEVTFTVSEEGQPIHSDAEVEIRPRLFLEGNFFLDLQPGSPSAPELASDDDIPLTQTATAVQLDEVLAALQEPQRRGLQRLLEGFGGALNYEPTAADDADQDPDVQGETAGESLNDAFEYGGPAGRSSAIVANALRGEQPGDLSGLIRSSAQVFEKLASRESELSDLITNFNVTAGAFAAESENLSASVRELGPTLEEADVSLRHLSDALPAVRALAIESRPGFQELPETIDVFEPWLDQTGQLVRDDELGGLSRLLRNTAPGLAETTAASRDLFPIMNRVSRCTTENLVPTADSVITADGFGTGQPNYQEFLYGLVQVGGSFQNFDGNGPYGRVQPAGGENFVQNTNPGATTTAGDKLNFGNAVVEPQGVQPVLPDGTPPFRMEVACHTNEPPNLNGPAAAAGPPDLATP